MRTSWPRTLRAKCTCRGSQCRSYSIGLARRIASTPAGRRALLFPTSTLLYSFMFGWGMLEDGHGKQQRREQWNHAIDQAKAELEEQKKAVEQRMRYLGQDEKERLLNDLDENANSTQDEHDERLQPVEEVAPLPTSSEIIHEWTQHASKARELLEKSKAGEHSVPEDAEPKADSEDSDAAQQKRWEKAAISRWMSEQERELWKDTTIYTMLARQKSTMEHNTAADLDIENVPPQSIYAPEETKRAGLRSRWTRRKIQATNLAMAKLVLRLIKEGVRKGDVGVEYSVREKRKRLETLPVYFHQIFWPSITHLGRIEFLITRQWYDTVLPPRDKQEDVPKFPPVFHNRYPYYSQDPHGQFHLDCYRMNHHIFNCFEQCFSGEISLQTLIMNICDSLMTSSAPPNITTYNALILGFTRLEQSTLVDFVIQAFEETYIRADEITSCAILNHYMRTDRANHFSNYVNMMTGNTYVANRRYLHLAHPLLHHHWHNQRVARKTHNRVMPHPTQDGKVVQKVFPTPKVFSRIIVGYLKFHGLEHTIELCTQLTRDGWAFDITGLTYFLAATAAEADWAAGVMVWQQIQDLRATAPPPSPPKTPHEAANPPLPPLDIEVYAHMHVLCDRCGRPDVAEHIIAEAYETSGHRPVPIQRLAARLAKGGRDAMLMKSLRSDDHRLRVDMGQQLAGDLRTWRAEENERRAEEEWLMAHAANTSEGGGGDGVFNWWEQESQLEDDAGGGGVETSKTSSPTTAKKAASASTPTPKASSSPQTNLPPHDNVVPPDQQQRTDAPQDFSAAIAAAIDDAADSDAIKAWETSKTFSSTTTAKKASTPTPTPTPKASSPPQTNVPPHDNVVPPDQQQRTDAPQDFSAAIAAAIDDAADTDAIKAWEAEAWMSTKSRRLYTHVRKVWSPRWEGQDEDSSKAGGGGGGEAKKHGASRGKESGTLDGGDDGGGGRR